MNLESCMVSPFPTEPALRHGRVMKHREPLMSVAAVRSLMIKSHRLAKAYCFCYGSILFALMCQMIAFVGGCSADGRSLVSRHVLSCHAVIPEICCTVVCGGSPHRLLQDRPPPRHRGRFSRASERALRRVSPECRSYGLFPWVESTRGATPRTCRTGVASCAWYRAKADRQIDGRTNRRRVWDLGTKQDMSRARAAGSLCRNMARQSCVVEAPFRLRCPWSSLQLIQLFSCLCNNKRPSLPARGGGGGEVSARQTSGPPLPYLPPFALRLCCCCFSRSLESCGGCWV